MGYGMLKLIIECTSLLLVPTTHVATKLLQICSQSVNKLCSHCLFHVVPTSLKQAVSNLNQA